jgi:hypothetical protein
LQLYVDDREDYRSTRDSMLQRFGGTDDSTRAAEMAVVCLIAPDAADLPDRVAGLIVPWLELPGENTLMAWTELAQGMAEYRRENFAASMDWLRRSRVTGKSQVAAFHAIAEFFLAMAEHRGSRPGEAQERLDEGERLLESAFRESKRAALGPFNVLMCAVVHREAEALVRGRADDETARYVRSTVVPPVAVNPANDSRPESALPQGSREGAPVVPEHEE